MNYLDLKFVFYEWVRRSILPVVFKIKLILIILHFSSSSFNLSQHSFLVECCKYFSDCGKMSPYILFWNQYSLLISSLSTTRKSSFPLWLWRMQVVDELMCESVLLNVCWSNLTGSKQRTSSARKLPILSKKFKMPIDRMILFRRQITHPILY